MCPLRFAPPVPYNEKIHPGCLPEPGDEEQLKPGMYCYVTGTNSFHVTKIGEKITFIHVSFDPVFQWTSVVHELTPVVSGVTSFKCSKNV